MILGGASQRVRSSARWLLSCAKTRHHSSVPATYDSVTAEPLAPPPIPRKEVTPLVLPDIAIPRVMDNPRAIADGETRRRAVTLPRRSTTRSKKMPSSFISAHQQQQQREHQKETQQSVVLAGGGDLNLGEFMEEVKTELWQYNAMPLRRRFRVQSLLRRLKTPPFELWSDSLLRATDSCPRPFTRTLLARHEGSPSMPPAEAPGFDLLLLCWRPGAASVIHDHPEAGCWVKVLKGEIRETRYSIAAHQEDKAISSSYASERDVNGGVERDGPFRETSARTLSPGNVTYIEDSMGYHKMENPNPLVECISLHLYSPGITECHTWADSSSLSNCGRTSLEYDSIFASGGTRRFDPRS